MSAENPSLSAVALGKGLRRPSLSWCFARRCPAPLAVSLALLVACSSKPPTPDWQMSAHGASLAASDAWLRGDSRVEAAEAARARGEIARTGRLELMARFELLRCATRVASLVLEPCAGFEPLRADASAADRAYANYLAGSLQPGDLALLPEQHRTVAQASGNADAAAAAIQTMADPLARLVAAGVLFRAAQAAPAVQAQAVDAASGQGWRRPLLAWLNVQLRAAEAGAQVAEAARLRRRIGLVQGDVAAQ